MIPRIVEFVCVRVLKSLVGNAIHDLKINRNNCLYSLKVFTVVFELAIGLFRIERTNAVLLVARLLAIDQNKAEELDEHDKQKNEDRRRHED